MATTPNSIPLGDIEFIDNFVPALLAGNYNIQVNQTLTGVDTGPLNATQAFVVIAPQVALDPTEINSTYPPANSTGQFADVLPHIVLNNPLLPWERGITSDTTIPWMALLVFSPEELAGPSTATSKVNQTTAGAYTSAPPSNIFRPAISLEKDVQSTNTVYTVQIPTTIFTAIAPQLSELRYLTHVRALNMGDKSEDGLSGTGLYSVVVANRFPSADASNPIGQQNIVHLVSMEGMGNILNGTQQFSSGIDTVELISLFNWTFHTLPDNAENFKGLMQNLVAPENPSGPVDPTQLWLRLSSGNLAAGNPKTRLDSGFVPMNYLTRSGEQTYAWFRGPLTPLLPTTFITPGSLATADAAITYDSTNGVFDLSLAAAWQAGRALALADKSFGATLLDWRRKSHRLVDRLEYVLNIQGLNTPVDLNAAAQSGYFRQLFDQALQTGIIPMLGKPTNSTPGGGTAPPSAAALLTENPNDAVASLKAFMGQPQVQAVVSDLTKSDLAVIGNWLARLALLYDVPFNNLVPDIRMLPNESIRFFYLDPNWMTALHDGALSIGTQTSRDVFYTQLTRDLIDDAATAAMLALRSQITGLEDDPSQDGQTHISGFIMRSAIASGWPGLAITGLDASGKTLKPLRIDHLASNVLLVLFWGVPVTLTLGEPQEGFRFGVDEQGDVQLRSLASTTLGQPLNTFNIRDLTGATNVYMRPGSGGRVLNLSPASATGLVQALATQVNVPIASFGPADFAIQMVNAPEVQTFNPPA